MQLTDWQTQGPLALDWLRRELPRRSSMAGLYADACAALGLDIPTDRLRLWLNRCPEWPAIKRTLGNGAGPHAPTGASAPSSPAAGRSLMDCIREQDRAQDRATCPACNLSPALRAQIAEAKRGGYTQRQILAALAGFFGVTLSPTDYQRHVNRRHEE